MKGIPSFAKTHFYLKYPPAALKFMNQVFENLALRLIGSDCQEQTPVFDIFNLAGLQSVKILEKIRDLRGGANNIICQLKCCWWEYI